MIYFTSPTWIKTYTPIQNNVDELKISTQVQFASKAFIKPMIGSYFFDYLLTAYNNQTLTPDQTTLVNKMQFAIGYRACGDLAIGLSYSITNKGIQVQNADNSESVEKDEIQFVSGYYKQQANFFEDELKKYLVQNSTLYPEFLSELNTDSNIKNSCNYLSYGHTNCGCGYCGKYTSTNNFTDGNNILFI